MRILFFVAAPLCWLGFARAAELTAADREALIEKLDKIKEETELKVDGRHRVAASAFRAAMASPEAAVDFYVKCVEKLQFSDLDKKESDFRAWRKKESENLRNPAFGRALCHQLRWLLLTLRASSEKSSRSELAAEAREAMEAVFRDAPSLAGQHQLLSQNVMGTIFVKTYDIEAQRTEKWVNSPVQINEIFDILILPPLRNASSLENLRAAWQRRIQLEGVAVDWSSGEQESAFGKPAVSPAREKFSTETLPNLKWSMEKDLFAAGDQQGACVRMMALIEANSAHKAVARWLEELRTLINPPAPPAPQPPPEEN